jgi:hypothetical protein
LGRAAALRRKEGRKEGRKVFFSEEKKQKTFRIYRVILQRWRDSRVKVFWFFFCKKERLLDGWTGG